MIPGGGHTVPGLGRASGLNWRVSDGLVDALALSVAGPDLNLAVSSILKAAANGFGGRPLFGTGGSRLPGPTLAEHC